MAIDIEDDVAELAQIALLGGDFDGVAAADDLAPTGQPPSQCRRQFFGIPGDCGGGGAEAEGNVGRSDSLGGV